MALIVCPTTVVDAPIERVWDLLTDPDSYRGWTGAELVRASPPGRVREGQVLDFRTRELGIGFRVRMDVGKPEPPRLLPLRVQMPFGIVNDERITLAPLDPVHTRVTLN
jgi:uncharacterized protein YndB with AHSA1/START domain